MGGSSKVTVGYWYKLGVHAAVCHGPVDSVKGLWAGERQAWTGNVTSNTSVRIDQKNLFGGKKREGGLDGYMDVLMGEDSQTPHETLVDVHGTVPAFRGILSLVFRGYTLLKEPIYQMIGGRPYIVGYDIVGIEPNNEGFTWAAMNPYLKPFWVKVKHILAGRPWYTAKAAIGDDMNAAHILWDAMTNTKYGLKIPTARMDDAAFTAAADKLFAENFGISIVWAAGTSAWDFVQLVLNHINGMIYIDPATGKFTLKLVRDDYVVGDLLTLDSSNIVTFGSFERAAWGEITNTVTVTYTNPETEQPADVTVHNLAAIRAQGGQVITSSVSLPGIRSMTLAQRIAQRDLRIFSTPLAKVSLEINRVGYDLRPGDVVKLDWAPLGITGMPMRITGIEYGTLTDGRIKVDAVEDVFGMPATSYLADQPSGWQDPSGPPEQVVAQKAVEATFWEINRGLPASIIADYDPAFGFGKLLAVKPASLAVNFSLAATGAATAPYSQVAVGEFVPTAQLSAGVSKIDTAFPLTAITGFADLDPPVLAMIDDEMVEYLGYDAGTTSHQFKRGVLDTVPVAHSSGARIYFDIDQINIDETERLDGETVYYKALTTNGYGTLDASSASASTLTLDLRYQRPYPPGKFTVNTATYPAAIVGSPAFAWAHRDRTQQTVDFVAQSEGNIGPEVGTTYTVKLYDGSNTLLHTEAGLTGTSWTYAGASEVSTMRVTIESVRDGLSSWTAHDHTFERAGIGLSLGKYLGGV